jgi:hypothetical protein
MQPSGCERVNKQQCDCGAVELLFLGASALDGGLFEEPKDAQHVLLARVQRLGFTGFGRNEAVLELAVPNAALHARTQAREA